LGVRRIFARNSPNLPKKFLCAFCPQTFSHTEHEDVLLVWPPKRVVFSCKLWAPFLPGFSGILPRFSKVLLKSSEILPKFSTDQNFSGCACTLASYTTGFKSTLNFDSAKVGSTNQWTIHNWYFRRPHICHAEDQFVVIKSQKFATGIFKAEFMSFFDKDKKWMLSHFWSSLS